MLSTIKKFLHKVIHYLVLLFFKDTISSRKLKGTRYRIYFQSDQFLKMFLSKEVDYEPNCIKSIRPIVKDNFLIFDVGANIGQYALLFSSMLGNNGKVISFEPNHEAFKRLQKNILNNNIDNVSIMNKGIGSCDTTSHMDVDSISGGRKSKLSKNKTGHAGVIVEVESLETAINKYGMPDLIKIDTEGYEYEILKSIDMLSVDNFSKTIILVEVDNSSSLQIFQLLKYHDCYSIDKSIKITGDDIVKKRKNLGRGMDNFLFIPKNMHILPWGMKN